MGRISECPLKSGHPTSDTSVTNPIPLADKRLGFVYVFHWGFLCQELHHRFCWPFSLSFSNYSQDRTYSDSFIWLSIIQFLGITFFIIPWHTNINHGVTMNKYSFGCSVWWGITAGLFTWIKTLHFVHNL